MALTHYYVSPASGNDTTGDGSSGTPWATVQKALDTITRNSTDGDQINVQAGTADVLGSSLSLATYGTPTPAAPLIIRGYTSAANDGGIGEISSNGANVSIFSSSTLMICFADMKLGNTGTATALAVGPYSSILHCEIHTTSGTGLIYYGALGAGGYVENCYFHDLTGNDGVQLGNGNQVGATFCGNYLTGALKRQLLWLNGYNSTVEHNVLVLTGADTSVNGITVDRGGCAIRNNTLYSGNANTGRAIAPAVYTLAANNIIQGWSGAGGTADISSAQLQIRAANAYYNNTSNESYAGPGAVHLATSDALAGAPFVDASTGDWDINGTVAGVTEDAWPQSWPGLTITTTPKPDKGAVQAGAGAGGVLRRVMRLMGG